jgi:hypothetical protein
VTTEQVPSKEEVLSYLKERRNWGRWGDDDQRGAINLITNEKRAAAAKLVRSGRSISISRDFPKVPGPGNPNPAQHWLSWGETAAGGGGVVDYYGITYHGYVATHVDALCHVWNQDGLWNGRNPKEQITPTGARWGAIHHWHDGITTRGVLLDVPKHRGEPFVTQEKPVHGWELEAIAKAEGGHAGAGRRHLRLQRPRGLAAGEPHVERLRRDEPRPPRLLPAISARQRRRGPLLGPDGRPPQRVRRAVDGARRDLRLRHRPGR